MKERLREIGGGDSKKLRREKKVLRLWTQHGLIHLISWVPDVGMSHLK